MTHRSSFMNSQHIPERFLHHVWQHQRFNAGVLHTTDGRKVEILFPGAPNSDGGPDFTGARIRIGNITFYGDVELHQDAQEWVSHLHQADQHYNKVILHVVLTADPLAPPSRTASKRFLPLLVLHPYLDNTLRSVWLQAVSDERNEQRRTIACHALNDRVPEEFITQWIERLALARMEMKVRSCEDRIKELIDEERRIVREPYPRYYGSPDEIPPPMREYTRRDFADKSLWEQLLYEAIMEGFGYSKNSKPFLLLSRSMRLAFLRQYGLANTGVMMALLFGAAGLIPSERVLTDRESRRYVRALRRHWRATRPIFKATVLHGGDWMFFRLRPSNFPTARLASMCFLLPSVFAEDGFRSMIGIFKEENRSARERRDACHRIFKFSPDEFWQHHYRFDQRPSVTGISLGVDRINDVIVNSLLPLVLSYARLFRDQPLRENALEVLKSFPSLQGNSITRLLQRQLMKEKRGFKSAFEQQGGIHLFKFLCTPVRCSSCEIGRLLGVKSLEDRRM
jgi:hypothetical protein